MKNKELYKLLKKNKLNTNSGFTLTELLVGLFMSIFVIGALGFGLMTVLSTTQSENSKVKARTENSRALDFISDELRQAKTVETDVTNAPRFIITGSTVVLALDIPEISNSATIDTDSNANTKNERIVYYLKSNSGTNWKGPQVLYRWGPPLDADGKYTAGTWQNQALIDGINSTPIATSELDLSCPTATRTRTPATPAGFYACLFRQDSTKPYQPDKAQANYNPSNTAQLFLTGQTKTASGVNNDSQTNDTQVVARARETLVNRTNINNSVTWSFKDIGGQYSCKSGTFWNMRTNFGTNPSDLNASTTRWDRDTSKQPQPIAIDTSKPLVITSSPTGGASDCTSRGNPGTGTLNLNASTTVKVSHAIDFGNPITFNGDRDTSSGATAYNITQVKTNDPAVQFLKRGTDVPSYGAYDANGDGIITIGAGSDDQPSLGRFLFEQGLAIPKNGADPYNSATEFIVPDSSSNLQNFLGSSYGLALTAAQKQNFKLMEDDQRIIAFEVGQIYPDKSNPDPITGLTTPSPGGKNPGFDLQDNIFVVTSDVFKKKFNPNCFGGSGCPPS